MSAELPVTAGSQYLPAFPSFPAPDPRWPLVGYRSLMDSAHFTQAEAEKGAEKHEEFPAPLVTRTALSKGPSADDSQGKGSRPHHGLISSPTKEGHLDLCDDTDDPENTTLG